VTGSEIDSPATARREGPAIALADSLKLGWGLILRRLMLLEGEPKAITLSEEIVSKAAKFTVDFSSTL
jgi:hypothetical protein